MSSQYVAPSKRQGSSSYSSGSSIRPGTSDKGRGLGSSDTGSAAAGIANLSNNGGLAKLASAITSSSGGSASKSAASSLRTGKGVVSAAKTVAAPVGAPPPTYGSAGGKGTETSVNTRAGGGTGSSSSKNKFAPGSNGKR